MTLEQAIVANEARLNLIKTLTKAVSDLDACVVNTLNFLQNPDATVCVDVDAFDGAQTSRYNAHLAAVEVAADALGTDD